MGAPWLTAMVWWEASKSALFPLSAANNTLAHSAHATHTALPFTCTRG